MYYTFDFDFGIVSFVLIFTASAPQGSSQLGNTECQELQEKAEVWKDPAPLLNTKQLSQLFLRNLQIARQNARLSTIFGCLAPSIRNARYSCYTNAYCTVSMYRGYRKCHC